MSQLVRLVVTAPSSTITVGQTLQCTATGVFDDLSEIDYTAAATWTSSAPGIATVGTSTGLVAPVSGGPSPTNTTRVTAVYGQFSGSLSVDVMPRAQNSCTAIDVADITTWAPVSFGFVAHDIVVTNVTGASGVEIQVSFDGVNVAGVVDAMTDSRGHSAVLGFSAGSGGGRGTIWLRRTTGSGGGPLYARVMAAAWQVTV